MFRGLKTCRSQKIQQARRMSAIHLREGVVRRPSWEQMAAATYGYLPPQ